MWIVALRIIALLIAGAAFGVPALAQPNYPSRPVRIIVASEAGGGTDIERLIELQIKEVFDKRGKTEASEWQTIIWKGTSRAFWRSG
jgi:tripartite-type tricarboxylate transporter receptor subunit TctC